MKFCRLLGAVKIFCVDGGGPPPSRLHEYDHDRDVFNSVNSGGQVESVEQTGVLETDVRLLKKMLEIFMMKNIAQW